MRIADLSGSTKAGNDDYLILITRQPVTSLELVFDSPTNAFATNISSNADLVLGAGDGTYEFEQHEDFIGWTFDNAVSSISFSKNIGTPGGSFALDNVSLGNTTAPVSLPAAVWLFGSALLGLTAMRKKKSSKTMG